MKGEKQQTGLLRKAKAAVKTWTVDDLVGFGRPDGMPFETYRQLRRLKSQMFERLRAPRLIWVSAASFDTVKKYLETADRRLVQHVQGTYRKAVHGLIGSANKTV